MKISKLMRKINKRKNDKKNIELIKNSGYFDEKYYLMNNQDVKNAGVNALKHYYYNGWKEGRNPSQKFDINKYLQCVGKIKENPILHYLKNKEDYPDFIVPYVEDVSVSNILKTYYKKNNLLKTRVVSKRNKHRINLFYKEFNKDIFFDGKFTPLIIAINLCNKYNYDLRIISMETDATIFYDFLEQYKLEFKNKVEFFSISFSMFLDVCQVDDFICTNWIAAENVLNTSTINGKVFYLIQDAEFNQYGRGDEYLKALNILEQKRVLPIVDSNILYEYFVKNDFSNVKKNGIYFEPAISKELYKTNANSFKKKNKYNLLYYVPSYNKTNLFYYSLEVLNKALEKKILNKDEWNVYVLGNNFIPSLNFEDNIHVEMLENISWQEYCNLLSNIDLFYCINYAIRPDYEILNASMFGAICLTNKNDNKKDLSKYSKNIVMSDLNIDDMLEALEKAIKMSLNFDLRKENYDKNNINKTWNSSIKEVLEFMHNHIGE